MRIATKTVYDQQKTQLGTLYKNLATDNNVVSTGKKINKLSDDPVGLTQVLNFKAGKTYLDQLDINIENGKTWLTTGETAMNSIEDLTLEMKTLTIKMKNDTINADQRKDAINQVNAALAELINLGNSQVKGQYIFSGNKTDIQTISADDLKNPEVIKYNGDTSKYQVKISQTDTMEVGQVGKDIFWEDEIIVDSTNNKIDFKETIQGGYEVSNIKAGDTLPDDTVSVKVTDYDALDKATLTDKPLHFTWNEADQVWEVRDDPGYNLPSTISGTNDSFDLDMDNDGNTDIQVRLSQLAEDNEYVEFDLVPHDTPIVAEIPEGKYTRKSLAAAVEASLTEASNNNGYKVEYNVSYDENTKKYTFTYDENSYPGYIKTDFLWSSGTNKDRSIGPDMGFDVQDATFEPAVSDHRKGKLIQAGVNDSLQFSVDGGTTINTITIPAGKYSNEELADKIETEIETIVGSINFTETFDVKFNNKDARFEFDASKTRLTAGDLQLLWNTGPSGLGSTMGFNTDVNDTGSLVYKGRSLTEKARITDGENDKIDFTLNGTTYSIDIPDGSYTNDELSTEIAKRMDLAAGVSGFSVSFDNKTEQFTIDATNTGAATFDLLWSTGANASSSAGEILGYNITADSTGALSYKGNALPLTIDIVSGVNDRVNFRELPQNGEYSKELSFTIDAGTYTGEELASFLEFQMEQQSSAEGYNIDYTVTYDAKTDQFKFRENGSNLDEIQFLWKTGADRPASDGGTGRSAAVTLGFDETEDHTANLKGKSDEETSWGLFDTLIDLKHYLENNDTEGMNRTLTRLDYHYSQQLSKVTEIGMKTGRLLTKESIISDVSFRYEENRAEIEEADMVEAISDLTSSQNAYQAALASSAKVMQLSLVDYLK